MATTSRGPLVIAIQTGGASPLVATALRARIDSMLPASIETNLDTISAVRREMKAVVSDAGERGRRWRAAAESGLLEQMLFGDGDRGLPELRRILGLGST